MVQILQWQQADSNLNHKFVHLVMVPAYNFPSW